jgi:endonuclease YncB( thermonuclease family)
MSFILEALKKSEHESTSGQVPDVTSFADNPYADKYVNQRFSLIKLVAGVVIIGGVGALATYLFLGKAETIAVANAPEKTAILPAVKSPVAPLKIEKMTTTPATVAPSVQTPTTYTATQPTTYTASQPTTVNAAQIEESVSPFSPERRVLTERPPMPDTRYRPPEEKQVFSDAEPSDGPRFQAKVVGVSSGCMIEVKQGKRSQKIKLANISCMNPRSVAGRKARRFITRAIFTKTVTVAFGEETGNNELVADIHSQDGVLINRQQVLLGLVSAKDLRFQPEEKQAKKQKKGMWSNPSKWLNIPIKNKR